MNNRSNTKNIFIHVLYNMKIQLIILLLLYFYITIVRKIIIKNWVVRLKMEIQLVLCRPKIDDKTSLNFS